MKNKLLFLIFMLTGLLFSNFIKNSFAQGSPQIWGMAKGGENNNGVIFTSDINGDNYTVHYNFAASVGHGPVGTKLLEASNGLLYGMTRDGGANNFGVIFEYNPATNIYTKKFDFDSSNGTKPEGSLIQASNGMLYGMTPFGGVNNLGVIFEFDPVTSTYTKKLDFNSTNGARPYGDLLEASNGLLYGMTQYGGAYGRGVIFEFDIATSNYNLMYSFSTSSGYNPRGSLIQASNGLLYGMTYASGGVIFEYNLATSTYTKKYSLIAAGGYAPFGSLMQASNGLLYGLTYYGGANDYGTLFEYNPVTSTFTKKIDFSSAYGTSPRSSLIQASNGLLYGTTIGGGANNEGALFEYNTATDTYTKKFDFDLPIGHTPCGSLIQTSNGLLYGLTFGGGLNNKGVIFEYNTTTDIYTKKYDLGCTDGTNPGGNIIQSSNGLLYGMTKEGGRYGKGVLFEYNPLNNAYTTRYDFGPDGTSPYGSLVQASNGMLYGMTYEGGANNLGVIFGYNPSTYTYTKLHDFDGIDGSKPHGSLMQASNGMLYGMTSGNSIIFEFNPATNTFTKKTNLYDVDGTNPYGDLIQASNGLLYGMVTYGTYNYGVIFEYNLATNIQTKKFEFDSANGSYPHGNLLQASNGLLYGMTMSGGANNDGVIFEYDLATSTFTKKFDFSSSDGTTPQGSLAESSNGSLYGITYQGGANNLGVIFEFDPGTNTYNKKLDFNGTNGEYSTSSFMEVSSVVLPIELLSFNAECTPEGVQLTWSTATETNNDFFTIEKTSDMTLWEVKGTVDGAGNSNSVKHYSFNDINSTDETTYYRLKQTDYDGSSTYSDVIYAKCTGTNSFDFNLSPNPASDQLRVSFNAKTEENATLRITNIMGGVVLNRQLKLQKGHSDKYIEITGLPAGIYNLTVTGNNYSYSRKFIRN